MGAWQGLEMQELFVEFCSSAFEIRSNSGMHEGWCAGLEESFTDLNTGASYPIS
jgi:hypothetical protein